MEIKITVTWQKQVSRNLRIVTTNIKNMRKTLYNVMEIVTKRTDEIFKEKWKKIEKWPNWKPLSISTLKARADKRWHYAKKPNRPQIMRRTWNLQDNRTIKSTNKKWTLTFNAPYAAYHQIWWKKLPKRMIIDIDNKTIQKIQKEFQKAVYKNTWVFWKQL